MVVSVPAVRQGALLLGAADRRQHLQLRLHRQPRHRERAGRLSRGRSRLEGRRRPPGSRRCFTPRRRSRSLLFRTQLFNPADMPNVVEGAGRLQGAAALGVSEAARAARRAEDRLSPGHHGGNQGRTSSSISTSPCSSCPPTPEDKDIRAKLASIGIGAGKTFDFKDLSPEHKAAVLLGMKEGDDKVDKYLASGNEEYQRLERRRVLRRPRFLQRRLADARRRRQGRHLRQRRRRGHVSLSPARTATARRSTAASTTTRSPSRPGSCRR